MGNPWAYDFSAIGRRSSPLLVVLGSDADPKTKAAGGYSAAGSSNVHQLIPEDLAFEQLNLAKPFYRADARPDMARYECVLNLVTDPDQHPRTLELLRKLLRGYRGRVINHPEAVVRSTREQVARRLAGIANLRVPKVLRLRISKPGSAALAAQRSRLAFPLIARKAGSHTGQTLALVENPAELDAACADRGDYILTEFVDFRSADGLFRKNRLWSFGGRALFKHHIVSDEWNVHNKDRSRIMSSRPDLIAEEQQLLTRPEGAFPEPIHAMFRQVQQRMGLDFFGMDFGIDRNGLAVLFEANATMSFDMSFDPPFDYLMKVNEPARQAFAEMLLPKA